MTSAEDYVAGTVASLVAVDDYTVEMDTEL